MKFFQAQRENYKKTKLLVLLFSAAIAGTTLAFYLVFMCIYRVSRFLFYKGDGPPLGWWQPEVLLILGGTLIVFIVGASLYKLHALKKGGRAIAQTLQARLVKPETKDQDEKKLINIIAEMALASGMSAPEVYILDKETGINALSAGHDKRDAIIAVTKGALDSLTRSEMQGLIAHEFSHILNGDMRINLFLIGILHGIVFLGYLGKVIMKGAAENLSHSGQGGNRQQSRGSLLLIISGFVVFVVGSIGVFFGKLIKSAICRQREFLADASAVQFTRYPDGIGNVLKKIGDAEYNSYVRNRHGEEFSHMFIAESLHPAWLDSFSTHPPIPDRIRRIEPKWNGKYIPVSFHLIRMQKQKEERQIHERNESSLTPMETITNISGGSTALIAGIGTVQPQNVELAINLIHQIPALIKKDLCTPKGAEAVVYFLLLHDERELLDRQLNIIQKSTTSKTYYSVRNLLSQKNKLQARMRLTLIHMAIPALRRLSSDDYGRFKKILYDLIQADEKIDLFEYCLYQSVVRHLEPVFENKNMPQIRFNSLNEVHQEVSETLNHLAVLGHSKISEAHKAYDKAIKALSHKEANFIFDKNIVFDLEKVDCALKKLTSCSPELKKQIITACAECVMSDNIITVEECEMLRAICDNMDCPLPLL